MSNSSLVNYTKLSPNYGFRDAKIDKITIHHMAGNLSVELCGDIFRDPDCGASSNYGVGTDGRIGMYVEEKNRPWTSSNRANDNRAVTIEVANDGGDPDWHVSDKALEATVNLCVDICQRNGITRLNYTGDKTGNLTMHKWFDATLCPGPYLESKFPYIAQEVNRRLQAASQPQPAEKLYRVQVGAFSKKANAERKRQAVEAAGFETILACVDGKLWRVQVGAFAVKANAEKMQKQLMAAGFSGFITTLSGKIESKPKKSIDEIAREVIRGDWGNGADRVNRLQAAGYDYDAVQDRVNALLS